MKGRKAWGSFQNKIPVTLVQSLQDSDLKGQSFLLDGTTRQARSTFNCTCALKEKLPVNLVVLCNNRNKRTWFHPPLEKTGVCPVSCSSTLAALVSLSPLSPTQMFKQSLRMRTSLMGFSFFSPWSWGGGERNKISNSEKGNKFDTTTKTQSSHTFLAAAMLTKQRDSG